MNDIEVASSKERLRPYEDLLRLSADTYFMRPSSVTPSYTYRRLGRSGKIEYRMPSDPPGVFRPFTHIIDGGEKVLLT